MTTPVWTRSRYAALALFGALIVCVFGFIVLPLVNEYSILASSVEQKRSTLARYRALAAQHETLRDRLGNVERQSRNRALYVAGTTAALASANMQKRLKSLVDRAGGELISTQQMGETADDLYPSAALRVRMRAEIEAMTKLLYQLEQGQPMFFLDDLSINARPLRSAAQADSMQGILDVSFTITGYLAEAG